MTLTNHRAAYDRASAYVRTRAGLVLPDNRRAFVEAGIDRAVSKAQLASVEDYVDRLMISECIFDDLISELTIGETYFFRDPNHFEFIRQNAVPEIRLRRGKEHVLQAWSAGCASGEEAYSLAILLEEERILDGSRVLATDISRTALAKAREGVYGEWSLRNPPRGLVERYFRRQGRRFILADRIRRSVTFDHLNLAAGGVLRGAANMDIILCRNVLIYIEPERIPAIAERLFAALADGGWLITGPSDPLLSSYAPFDVALTPAGVFYRRGAMATVPIEIEDDIGSNSTAVAQPASIFPPPDDPLSLARTAFARGDYAKVLHLVSKRPGDIKACELHVLSLANLGLATEAERVAAADVADDPLTADRHMIHAITLMSLRRYEAAIAAARRTIYLKSDFPVAHLILGTILYRVGAVEEARRAIRNSRALASVPLDHMAVPCVAGEFASHFAAAETAHLALLDETGAGLQ